MERARTNRPPPPPGEVAERSEAGEGSCSPPSPPLRTRPTREYLRKPSAKADARAEQTLARARELRRNATLSERSLWNLLRRNRLGLKFRRQHPIGRYVVDFYCHAAALAVELDGLVHGSQQEEDEARDAWLRTQGVDVFRMSVPRYESNRLDAADLILRLCSKRAAERSRTSEGEAVKKTEKIEPSPPHCAAAPLRSAPPPEGEGGLAPFGSTNR